MWPIEQLQKDRRQSLVSIAREFARRGLSIARMATELDLDYSSLKRALKLRGYTHPRGMSLVAARIEAETKWTLEEYVALMVKEGLSRNQIAVHLGIDNKTLQAWADSKRVLFPSPKSRPRSFDAIIAATRSRQGARSDLVWIEYGGERLYLAQWARKIGISVSTLRKRLALSWSVEEALIPSNGRYRHKSAVRPRIPGKLHPWRSNRTSATGS